MSIGFSESSFDRKLSFDTNITGYVASEVVRICALEGITIDKQMALYAINLMRLDPVYGTNFEQNYDRTKGEEFMRYITSRLKDQDYPTYKTLKIQVHYLENELNRQRIYDAIRDQTLSKIQPLMNDIIEWECENTIENLFKKIAVFIVINNSMGNPSHKKVINENYNTLMSIATQNDMIQFCRMRSNEKFEYINHISDIVCGIRIMNKDNNIRAEGVPDLVSVVSTSYTTTSNYLSNSLNETQRIVNLLSTALTVYLKSYNETDERLEPLVEALSEKYPIEELKLIKSSLIMFREHEHQLHELIKYLNEIKISLDKNIIDFHAKLKIIHEEVDYRVAIPAHLIFPKFQEISLIWRELYKDFYALSKFNSVNNTCEKFMKENCSESWEKVAYSWIGQTYIETDIERLLNSQEKRVHKSSNDEVILILKAGFSIKQYDPYSNPLELELNGYCAWSLSQGILLRANPQIGIFKYFNRKYSFREAAGALCFIKDPNKIISQIIESVRAFPGLIKLLNIYDFLRANRTSYKRNSGKTFHPISMDVDSNQPARCEAMIQTETHPIPNNTDKNYTWNAWDSTFKIIQLAHITQCQTHSTQTYDSYYRMGKGTQTIDVREKETQTVKNELEQVSRELWRQNRIKDD